MPNIVGDDPEVPVVIVFDALKTGTIGGRQELTGYILLRRIFLTQRPEHLNQESIVRS